MVKYMLLSNFILNRNTPLDEGAVNHGVDNVAEVTDTHPLNEGAVNHGVDNVAEVTDTPLQGKQSSSSEDIIHSMGLIYILVLHDIDFKFGFAAICWYLMS